MFFHLLQRLYLLLIVTNKLLNVFSWKKSKLDSTSYHFAFAGPGRGGQSQCGLLSFLYRGQQHNSRRTCAGRLWLHLVQKWGIVHSSLSQFNKIITVKFNNEEGFKGYDMFLHVFTRFSFYFCSCCSQGTDLSVAWMSHAGSTIHVTPKDPTTTTSLQNVVAWRQKSMETWKEKLAANLFAKPAVCVPKHWDRWLNTFQWIPKNWNVYTCILPMLFLVWQFWIYTTYYISRKLKFNKIKTLSKRL